MKHQAAAISQKLGAENRSPVSGSCEESAPAELENNPEPGEIILSGNPIPPAGIIKGGQAQDIIEIRNIRNVMIPSLFPLPLPPQHPQIPPPPPNHLTFLPTPPSS